MTPQALWTAASQPTPAESADIAVLTQETTYVFEADGRVTRNEYIVFKTLTQRGVEGWANYWREWDPWHQERPVMRARVITPDFAIHELDMKAIADTPAGESGTNTYSDRRGVHAPLPAMAIGSVVEEEVSVKDNAPFFPAGMVYRCFVGIPLVPIQHFRLVLDAPSSLPLKYAVQMLANIQPARSEADGRVKVVFDVPAITLDDVNDTNLPSDYVDWPMIEFASGASWQNVVEEYSKIVDERIKGEDLKGLVAKLTFGKNTTDQKIQALVEYLNTEVRYTGIEFSEASIVPHRPQETLSHKYGDCKDKASLLVAMLRTAGIPAYVALLNAGSRLDVAADLPGLGIFDHAIVYVPGQPDHWIDATDEYARLGQLPAGDQGRLALVVRPGADKLIKTAESSSQDNVLLETREIRLAENGPADIIETSHPQGSFESEFRGYYADEKNKGTHDSLNDYMKSQYLADKLDYMERSTPGDFSKSFELVLESKKAKRGFTDLDTAVAAIRLEGLFYRLPKDLRTREDKDDKSDNDKPKKPRTGDYLLREPFVAEWRYNIIPPAGFQVKALPANVNTSIGPAKFSEQFNTDDNGAVHVLVQFDTVKRRFTTAEANEIRNKVSDLSRSDAILVNFEPRGQALLREGKTKESFQSYRSLMAQHPKEALHHLQLAKAFLDSGMGDAARDEARTAVKLEPNSALAQKTLAQILEYDLVGRRFRPGSDFAGAVAAYRAAIKLDPDDKNMVGDLAILLEYNDTGSRYGSGAKLKESIETYRSLPEEKLISMGLQNNPAYTLFYAGEFAEARKNAATLSQQPHSLIVACEAAINGAQAGIAEANKRAGSEKEFKDIVKSAGEMLLNVRAYPAAADLMQAGASGENASGTIGLASMVRKARRHEEIQFPDDPSGMVSRYFLLSIDSDVTLEKMTAMMSKNARRVLEASDKDEIDSLLKVGKKLRSQLARSGASPDVTIDVLLESLQPKADGNDTVGYREKVQIAGGKKLTLIIVKEDGKYKVLDSMEKPNAIALEILDRVNANDLDGARIFLDWVREEQHLGGGDDPYEGEVFPRFWTKGAPADAVQMKLAAAALLAQTKPTAKQGVAILEEASKSATDDTLKTNIDMALMLGYSTQMDAAKLLDVTQALSQKNPDSRRIFIVRSMALRLLEKFDDANALAQQRLKKLPDDTDALHALIMNATARGDHKAAYDLNLKIIDSGKAEAYDYNNMAWQTLYYDNPNGPDIASAIKSSQLNQNNPSTLHTLGCLYAATGKTKEAREVLIQAMDLLYLDEPSPDYWYAFGRIAEQFGEIDVARADYARVTQPKLSYMIPDSSYQLAQDRLKLISVPEKQIKTARNKN